MCPVSSGLFWCKYEWANAEIADFFPSTTFGFFTFLFIWDYFTLRKEIHFTLTRVIIKKKYNFFSQRLSLVSNYFHFSIFNFGFIGRMKRYNLNYLIKTALQQIQE